jgi:hypothetical protein
MPQKTQEEQDQLAAQFREECIAEGVVAPESEAANDPALLKSVLLPVTPDDALTLRISSGDFCAPDSMTSRPQS